VTDVRRFVAGRGDASSLRELTAAKVSHAVLGEVDGRSLATVRRYGCALRAFLRYGHVAGLIETDLRPRSCRWPGGNDHYYRRDSPRPQTRALLRGCDRRRAVGRRDYAVMVLILRLGLWASG
jgi:hypothetical protein